MFEFRRLHYVIRSCMLPRRLHRLDMLLAVLWLAQHLSPDRTNKNTGIILYYYKLHLNYT